MLYASNVRQTMVRMIHDPAMSLSPVLAQLKFGKFLASDATYADKLDYHRLMRSMYGNS